MNTITIEFDNHLIMIPDTINHLIFDEGYCWGIRFFYTGGKTELIHNRQADLSRIFIAKDNGEWHDIPFKPSAFNVLPNGVCIIDMKEKSK